MGDKGVHISHARWRIVQVLHLLTARRDEFQAEGRANGHLTRCQLTDGLHVVHIVVGHRLVFCHVQQVAVQGAHPQTAVPVVAGGIDVVVSQRAVARGIDTTHVGVVVNLIDAFAIGCHQHVAVRLLIGVQHHCSLTAVLPLVSLGVQDADAVVCAHQQQLVGEHRHHVDMIVAQALGVVLDVLIDGGRTANGACDVDAARVRANDDVLPGVHHHTIDAIAMKHAASRFVGVEQHGALALTVATHLIHALAIHANEHGLVVVGTDAAYGVQGLGVASEFHKGVGRGVVVVTQAHNVQTVLIAAQPQLA